MRRLLKILRVLAVVSAATIAVWFPAATCVALGYSRTRRKVGR